MIPRRRPDAPLQRISRRGLITSGVLAGVLAASGVPVHAQRRGGVLRLALPAFGGWGIGPQDLTQRVAGQGAVFDCLTEIAASGEVVGEAAQGWEARDSGALWTFALRPARFHDGSPVTAQDVVDSLLRHRDPASPCAWLLARMEDVTAPAPDRLRIRLTHPDADLPLLLADPHLVIAPGGVVESGIGSGLYRLQDGDLIRVAQHWKDGRAGWFDRVVLLQAETEEDRLALLMAGQADAAALSAMPQGQATTTVAPVLSLVLSPPWPPDGALTAARLAPDRAAAFAALESQMSPGVAYVIAHGPRLRHGEALGGLAPLDSGRIAERWWFA